MLIKSDPRIFILMIRSEPVILNQTTGLQIQTEPMVNRGYFSILTFFFAISLSGYSQTMIDYKAGYMEGFKKDGADIQRLVGNVVFIDNSTTMYCDSAYLYENKDF